MFTKVRKIVFGGVTLCISMLISTLANAYYVYNYSNFQKISVEDSKHNFINHRMGKQILPLNGYACCPHNNKGCNKGAKIKVKVSEDISYSALLNHNKQDPYYDHYTCPKVNADGTLTITGGAYEPFVCIIP